MKVSIKIYFIAFLAVFLMTGSVLSANALAMIVDKSSYRYLVHNNRNIIHSVQCMDNFFFLFAQSAKYISIRV